MSEVDVAVIGAGVVGLACAAELASAGRTVCVLERHPRPGLDTSTHNSGVMHAGMYYPPGSLKARLCVEGRRLLYDFCAKYKVPHAKSGKLIVGSTADEIVQLEKLYARGLENDVEELELVDEDFVRAREPHVRATAALWSGATGILEPEALVSALKHVCDDRDVMLVVASPVLRADQSGDALVVHTPQETITATTVVNCAGLYSDDVSKMFGGEDFQDLPVPRRVCGADAGEAIHGERARLSPAARVRTRPRSPRHKDDVGIRAARPDDSLSGAQGRLRDRSTAG